MRAGVLLALLDQDDVAERALVDELLGAHVLRREEQLLGVHQLDAGLAAGGDHRVGLFQGQAERLLADDVLAGAGGVDADLRVQVVRHPDGDHVEIVALEHLSVIGEVARDTELIGKGAAPLGLGEAMATTSAFGTCVNASAWRCPMNPAPMIPTFTRSPFAMLAVPSR